MTKLRIELVRLFGTSAELGVFPNEAAFNCSPRVPVTRRARAQSRRSVMKLQTMKWIQSALLLSALALPAAALTGCNTTKGVGKDVENVGEEIQDVADEAAD
jgi:predicted small secreted protein